MQWFSDEENYMHTQAVTGRKYFMKQKIEAFLNKQQNKGGGQVVILAAGIAPLSIEIASLFPTSIVFDVDKFLMKEKDELVNGQFKNIRFIECDITNVEELNRQLINSGFDPEKPAIFIMEGIIYYIRTSELENLLRYFNSNHFELACDFCLKPELVNEKTRIIVTDVFRKIKKQVHLDFVSQYSVEEITHLMKQSGFNKIEFTNMQQIQQERKGEKTPFEFENSSWLHTIHATV